MGPQLGIIAGSGSFPFYILREAQHRGYKCVVAGIKGEAQPALRKESNVFKWVEVNDILNLIYFFKQNNIKEAFFAGKIDPRVVYNQKKAGQSSKLVGSGKEKTPTSILRKVIRYMDEQGIKIKDPSPFLTSIFCDEGLLNSVKVPSEVEQDIDFGWKIAKKIADMDIGQTVVVKDKAVVAVEGMEGTDETIKRGGELAGEGTTVVKVSRSFQDNRIDLPTVGLDTVKSLVRSKARALCFEAGKMPFFNQEESIFFADKHMISLIAKKS